jgi:hypothetical protein
MKKSNLYRLESGIVLTGFLSFFLLPCLTYVDSSGAGTGYAFVQFALKKGLDPFVFFTGLYAAALLFFAVCFVFFSFRSDTEKEGLFLYFSVVVTSAIYSIYAGMVYSWWGTLLAIAEALAALLVFYVDYKLFGAE